MIVRFVGCGRFRVNIFAIARPASSRRRLSLCVTAAVVVVAANVAAFRDLNATHATAARLRRHQAATLAQVRTRDGQLVATVTDVNATAASLSTRNEERDLPCSVRSAFGTELPIAGSRRCDTTFGSTRGSAANCSCRAPDIQPRHVAPFLAWIRRLLTEVPLDLPVESGSRPQLGSQSGVVIAEAPHRTSRRIAAAIRAYCRFPQSVQLC